MKKPVMAPVRALAAGPVKTAIAAAAMKEAIKERRIMARMGSPPFRKSSSVYPCSFIQCSPKMNGEYQKLPMIRFTIAASITAHKLMCDKESGNMKSFLDSTEANYKK
jgi:hypothetical protein